MRAPVTISSKAEPRPRTASGPLSRANRCPRAVGILGWIQSELTLMRRSKHEDEPFHQRPANVDLRSWPLQAPSMRSYRRSSPRQLTRTGDNVERFLPKAPRRLPFRLSHLRKRPAGRGGGHWRRKFSPSRLQRQFLALGRKRPFKISVAGRGAALRWPLAFGSGSARPCAARLARHKRRGWLLRG